MAKISRRPVPQKPEEVLTLAQRLLERIRPYKNLIFLGSGAVVLILAAFLGYAQWQTWRERQAEAALVKVRPQLSRPAEVATALPQLDQLRRDYPGTAAALEADLFRAHLLYQTGKYSEAAQAYQELKQTPLGRYPSYDHLLADSLSYCYEAQGDFAKAAAALAPLADQTGGAWQRDILLRLARLWEAAGNPQQAQSFYARLLAQPQDPAMQSYLQEKLAATPKEATKNK